MIYGAVNQSETEEKDEGSTSTTHMITLGDMFKKYYFKAFWIGCVLSIVQQLSGINAVVFYSNDLFKGGDNRGEEGEKAA